MKGAKMKPVEYKIVVRPDAVEETTGSGIIVKTEKTQFEEWLSQTVGTLVAANAMAFAGWTGNVPTPGDKVYFAKFAGVVDKDNDCRIMNDKDILAIF